MKFETWCVLASDIVTGISPGTIEKVKIIIKVNGIKIKRAITLAIQTCFS